MQQTAAIFAAGLPCLVCVVLLMLPGSGGTVSFTVRTNNNKKAGGEALEGWEEPARFAQLKKSRRTMKNPNAILPKPQELNESVRNTDQIRGLSQRMLMIEPKFDGSFIYVTRDKTNGKTILCTKDGNELSLEPKVQQAIISHFQRQGDNLFEAELEPVPWSEEAKAALNGNLYSRKAMPFGIRVVVHDMLPFSEVNAGRTTARGRYQRLCGLAGTSPDENRLKPRVWPKDGNVTICLSPCVMATPDQAAKLFDEGWARGKAEKRVYFASEPYEGLVAINPESTHKGGRSNKWKFKPFHSVDVRVTSYSCRDTGKVTTYTIEGKDTKTGEKIRLFTGISPELYQEIVRAHSMYKEVIVEVEALAIKSLAHGNPTLKGVRYDKMEPKTPELAIS